MGKTGSGIFNDNSTPTVTYSIVQGIGVYAGTGNLNTDPLFVNASNPAGADGIWRTADDGLQVSNCSPTILAGTPVGSSSLDIIGTTRNTTNPTMGAYENINDIAILAQAAISNTGSIAGTSQQSFSQSDGTGHHYTDSNCNIIATVIDSIGGNILDSTIAYVVVDSTIHTYNGQPYCRRHYEITPSSQGAALVTLYLTQADFDDYYANNGTSLDLPTSPTDVTGIANVRITQVHGTGGLGVGTPQVITPTLTWDTSTMYWTATFTVDSFSQFYFHGVNANNSPLPVTLLHFTGNKEANANVLYWETVSEHNNAYFILQSSTDAISFHTIGSIPTKATNGNSSATLYYNFIDAKPNNGYTYYRLQQIDNDGKTATESQVIYIYREYTGNAVHVYPNPSKGMVNIDFISSKNDITTIKVLDMTGRIVQLVATNTSKGKNNVQIDIQGLANGFYTLQIVNNDNLISIHKIEKQ